MADTKTIAPYGTWKSPITTDLLIGNSLNLHDVRIAPEGIFWTEGRPLEKGRIALVHSTQRGHSQDVTPPDSNVRTRVHEYGGICFVPFNDHVYFVNYSDQRIYCSDSSQNAFPITPENSFRYADLVVDVARRRLICVCEDHSAEGEEAVNSIVAISLEQDHALTTLESGNDFYANPRLSPDGTQLAWVTWNHPNMPWDSTELMLADIDSSGNLNTPMCIAGGADVAVFQPEWSPEGVLYFIADPEGWWNFHRYQNGNVDCLLPMEAEFGLPQWVFGMSTYAFQSATQLYCTYSQKGIWHLASLDLNTHKLTTIPTEFSEISSLSCDGNTLVFLASSPTTPEGVYAMDMANQTIQCLKLSNDLEFHTDNISQAQAIEFPSANQSTAHAFYYPPQNRDYESAEDELPPLVVIIHGGPTGQSSSCFNLGTQYWTNRGFAVLDINHRGSTGFGRAYRTLLYDNWGVVDYEDCLAGAQYLVSQKLADPQRLCIRGGSAGGYTVLCALTFGDVFTTGASYFGVSDVEALARDTHKFESRYCDRLIGPYPEQKALYQKRSPIHSIDQLSCPVIVLQGLDDKIVPPNQAEMIVDALKKKGVPVAYLAFAGEQHGFRKASNIKRSREAEFSFYAQIFGFEPADPIEPVEIINGRNG